MSKGSKRRPRQISREEENMRWKLAYGMITFNEYEKWRKQYIKRKK